MVDPVASMEEEQAEEKPYDSSDPEQVNNARKKAARKTSIFNKVIELLLQHEDGRYFLYKLIFDECKTFVLPIAATTDLTYFNLGAKSVGEGFLRLIATTWPDKFILMMTENAKGGR